MQHPDIEEVAEKLSGTYLILKSSGVSTHTVPRAHGERARPMASYCYGSS